MKLCCATGAPGAGKSTVCASLAALGRDGGSYGIVALDIDVILESASALARRDIRTDAASWPHYDRLWLDLLGGIAASGSIPVLFTPWTPDVTDRWAGDIAWLRLDCSDSLRRHRLDARGWPAVEIEEALADAAELRDLVPATIDTGKRLPDDAANDLLAWLGQTLSSSRNR